MTWKTTFSVVGVLSFPDDMLRYDDCAPATESDAAAIARKRHPYPDLTAARERTQVALVHAGARRSWGPTFDRWRSFNWSVIRDSIITERA